MAEDTPSLTVREAVEAKLRLSVAIENELYNFSKKTGLKVTSLYLREFTTVGDFPRALIDLTVEV
jgi:hypothetical protein